MEEEMIRRIVGVVVKEAIQTTIKTIIVPAAIAYSVYRLSNLMFRKTGC